MEQGLIPPLLGVIAFLVSVLIAVIGWIGNRIFHRMDSIQNVLRQAEKDLHVRIDDHEHRITRVETHCNIQEDRRRHSWSPGP